MRQRRLYLTSFFLFVVFLLHGQKQHIRFSNYTIRDGLSQSSINCILQDRTGFIWMGTQDGLNKFDGYTFDVFRHNPFDSTSLCDNFIQCIAEAQDGKIWIGTDNGLCFFDPEIQKFSRVVFPEMNNNGQEAIRTIVPESDTTMWIGTSDNGLFYYNFKSGSFKHFLPNMRSKYALSSAGVQKVYIDKNDNVWIGTIGGGLCKYNRNSRTFDNYSHHASDSRSLSNNLIWDITEDQEGALWIATNNGISILDPLNPVAGFKHIKAGLNGLSNAVVRTLLSDKNTIWAGTDKGLNEIQVHGNTFQVNQNFHSNFLATSLVSNLVREVFMDRYHSIWVGTNGGLSRFEPSRQWIAHMPSIPGASETLSNPNVWCILQDDHHLFVGTRHGLDVFDSSGIKTNYISFSNSSFFANNPSVLSLCKYDEHTLYIGTSDGLYRAALNSNGLPDVILPVTISDQFKSGQSELRVYRITRDREGMLWVGTREGLSVVNPATAQYHWITADPVSQSALSNNVVRDILVAGSGIWIATERGLCKVTAINDTVFRCKRYLHVNNDSGALSNNMILSLWEEHNGTIWIGTYGGGLNKLDPVTGIFRAYTIADGLPNNAVYGVLGDHRDNLWLSTNQGISRFNIADQSFRNFTELDGLQSNEFNTGAYYQYKGLLFFGGINGLNIIHPFLADIDTTAPLIVLTQFSLFNEPVIPGNKMMSKHISIVKKVHLNYTEDNITIAYSGLYYTNPLNLTYEYKLDGVDPDFVHAGSQRFANYTNLDPGNYTFYVYAITPDGIRSRIPAQLYIVVTPPIWERWWFRLLLFIVLAGGVFLFIRNRINNIKAQKINLERIVKARTLQLARQRDKIQLKNEQLGLEKEKVDKLLSNILPQETVEELKVKGKATARQYRLVTVMFTDIKGFTKISESLKPQQLVSELDKYFVQYDEVIERHDIEKIKTIGDAYMCAGGVPIRNKSNPIDVVLAGLEIQHLMKAEGDKRSEKDGLPWEVRIGVHTGELIAGVVGIKRFAYDIWGDTVNVASRMEQSGEVGKVNISGRTFRKIRNFFDCTYRGKIAVKNKGEVEMYFVDRIKEDLSADQEGHFPNDMFWEYVNLELYSSINYRKAEKFIVRQLTEGLSPDLHYHGIHHMRDVCTAVERIGKAEGVKGEDLFLLKTAGLYHDAGFIHRYIDNEPIGAKLAKEALPRFGYSEEQLDIVEELILATSLPQQPKTKLQEIICDADLDYLGRADFYPISDTLRREFLANGIVRDDKDWDELQIKFLSSHQYFTKTCQRLREPEKQKRLKEIKERFKHNIYD